MNAWEFLDRNAGVAIYVCVLCTVVLAALYSDAHQPASVQPAPAPPCTCSEVWE